MLSVIRYSTELQNNRSVIYYLPPSYTENTLKPYSNLLVMHDGQNLFNPKTSAFGTAWMVPTDTDAYIIHRNHYYSHLHTY